MEKQIAGTRQKSVLARVLRKPSVPLVSSSGASRQRTEGVVSQSQHPPAPSGQPPLHKQTTGNKRSASEASCANLLIFSLSTSRVGRLDGGDAPLRADAPRRGRCVYPPSGRLSPVGNSLTGGRGGPASFLLQTGKSGTIGRLHGLNQCFHRKNCSASRKAVVCLAGDPLR